MCLRGCTPDTSSFQKRGQTLSRLGVITEYEQNIPRYSLCSTADLLFIQVQVLFDLRNVTKNIVNIYILSWDRNGVKICRPRVLTKWLLWRRRKTVPEERQDTSAGRPLVYPSTRLFFPAGPHERWPPALGAYAIAPPATALDPLAVTSTHTNPFEADVHRRVGGLQREM